MSSIERPYSGGQTQKESSDAGIMARGSAASTANIPTQSDSFQPVKEVTYLTKEADGRSKGAWKNLRTSIQLLFLWGIPIMCASLAIVGPYKILFTIGAVFGAQRVYLQYRIRRFVGPLVDDAATRARVSPILIELCAAANCAVPQVQIKRTRTLAGVARIGGRVTLLLSPDFLSVADESELRAVMSHEVTHMRREFPSSKKIGRQGVFLVALGAFLLLPSLEHINWTYVALFIAYFVPVVVLIVFLIGPLLRKRETRADLEGAAVINDSAAMVRGLTALYSVIPEIRRRIYGPKAWRWMWFPYSLPGRTHPPLPERVAALRSMSIPDTLASSKLPLRSQPQVRVFRLIVTLVGVVGLFVILHHNPSPSVPSTVVTPRGTHFVSLSSLELDNVAPGFTTLTPSQAKRVTTPAKVAVAKAEDQLGINRRDDVAVDVAEANFSVHQFDVDFGSSASTGSATTLPVFVVLFSGPYITNLDEPNVTAILEIVSATGPPVARTIYLDAQ